MILDPGEASLEPGEILVAPSTDPGWTPLFLTAGGLVMEMGGPMSHGAIVAREYGIPAVVGVPDATGRISTGQRITVDGSAGEVTPDPEGAGRPEISRCISGSTSGSCSLRAERLARGSSPSTALHGGHTAGQRFDPPGGGAGQS